MLARVVATRSFASWRRRAAQPFADTRYCQIARTRGDNDRETYAPCRSARSPCSPRATPRCRGLTDRLSYPCPSGGNRLAAFPVIRGPAYPEAEFEFGARVDGVPPCAVPLGLFVNDSVKPKRGEPPMSGGTTKQRVLEAIEKLPADATLEDAIERLVLLAKIERGLAELDAGHAIEHAEATRRLLR